MKLKAFALLCAMCISGATMAQTLPPAGAGGEPNVGDIKKMLDPQPDQPSSYYINRKDLTGEDVDVTTSNPTLYDEKGKPLGTTGTMSNNTFLLPGTYRNTEDIANSGDASLLQVNALTSVAGITGSTVALVEPLLHTAANSTIQNAISVHRSNMDSLNFALQQAILDPVNGGTQYALLVGCIKEQQRKNQLKFDAAVAGCLNDLVKNSTTQPPATKVERDFSNLPEWQATREVGPPTKEQLQSIRGSDFAFYIAPDQVDVNKMTDKQKVEWQARKDEQKKAVDNLRNLFSKGFGDIVLMLDGDEDENNRESREIKSFPIGNPGLKLKKLIEDETILAYNALFYLMNRKCVFLAVEDPSGLANGHFAESEFRRGLTTDQLETEMEQSSFWYSKAWVPNEMLRDVMVPGVFTFKPAFGDQLYQILVGKKITPGQIDCSTLNPMNTVDYEDNGTPPTLFAYNFENFTDETKKKRATPAQNIFRDTAEFIAKAKVYNSLLAVENFVRSTPDDGNRARFKNEVLKFMYSALPQGNSLAEAAYLNKEAFKIFREQKVMAQAAIVSGRGGQSILFPQLGDGATRYGE